MRRVLLLVVVLAAACKGGKSGAPPDAGPSGPAQLTLTPARKDLLFTFLDSDGKLKDVDSADKVPPDKRAQVVVRDLSKSPEELQVDKYVYVADLTRQENGAWPVRAVSRMSLDDRLATTGPSAEGDGGTEAPILDDRVVLYGTSWCGACAQARKYMQEKGIPFVDKDIEADPKAEAELMRKAKRAGMDVRGVPVIDVHGTLMMGFDPGALERALKRT